MSEGMNEPMFIDVAKMSEYPDLVLPATLARWLRRTQRSAERDAVLLLLDRRVAGDVVADDEWLAAADAAEWAAEWAAAAAVEAAALAADAELAAMWAEVTAHWTHRAGVPWPEILGDLRAEMTEVKA